ncbi:TonB family protein [Cribrihabitans sp. XS_ASV171]
MDTDAVSEPQVAPLRDPAVPQTAVEPKHASVTKPTEPSAMRPKNSAEASATPLTQMARNGDAIRVIPPTTTLKTAKQSLSAPVQAARTPEAIAAAPIRTAQPAVNRPTEATVRPVSRPKRAAPQPKREPPETTVSKPTKPVQKNTGNSGRNAKKGSNSGSEQAKAASQGAGEVRADGNASLSNYKGQVFRRIARARRGSVDMRGEVLVALTISGSGGLSGVRVARGSGSARLDSIALAQVKRAAPFPRPPDGLSHTFSVRISGK